MDPVEDKDLLYIAKEGLKAPVVYPWEALRSEDDDGEEGIIFRNM